MTPGPYLPPSIHTPALRGRPPKVGTGVQLSEKWLGCQGRRLDSGADIHSADCRYVLYLTANVNWKVISPTSLTGMILQRRKDTASLLRQAAEKANTLEEAQVTELKHQIKVAIESYISMAFLSVHCSYKYWICVYTPSIGSISNLYHIETVNYNSVLCKLFCTSCKLQTIIV